MKKKSKRLLHSYDNVKWNSIEYYGVLMKNGRARIDTRRFKKFFELPDNKIEHRKTPYYIPSKKQAYDYNCNIFSSTIRSLKEEWYSEFSNAIRAIKTPKEIEDNVRVNYMCDGVFDASEADTIGRFAGMRRQAEYRYIIKSLYSQYFQQMMSEIDALSLRVITDNGYKERKFSKENFDIFIQGKQKKDVKSFVEYENYKIYDRAYRVWNFLKHNSIKAYNQLKDRYPEMIYDPQNDYQNGQSSLTVLKIDEQYILKTLEDLPKFFNEVCERGFGENTKDAEWDYDDYFIGLAESEIENIENPLGIPSYL